MKVFILADAFSPHTQRWIKSLSENNIEIALFSFSREGSLKYYENLANLKLFLFERSSRSWKLAYLMALPRIFQICIFFKPDIIHSHFASSYGLLGALLFKSKFCVSVWGSDVYEFPRKSKLHTLVISFVFLRAQKVFSTSETMAKETSKYTSKEIQIIPFGVDLTSFSPTLKNDSHIVVGYVKALELKYGITDLLKAFASLVNDHKILNIKLLIVGKGSLSDELICLANELGIQSFVKFTGWVEANQVAEFHKQMHIEVYPSICSESFGVAVVEASACENAVIVSRMGGLPEVVKENETGLIVSPSNLKELVEALLKLVSDKELRQKLGKSGRQRVSQRYAWSENVKEQIQAYKRMLST